MHTQEQWKGKTCQLSYTANSTTDTGKHTDIVPNMQHFVRRDI